MRLFNYTIVFILIIILGSTFQTSSQVIQVQQGNVVMGNDTISIKVTGNNNLPRYHFWSPVDNETVYSLQFQSLFEIEDQSGGQNGIYDDSDKRVPRSNLAFPSLDWNFTEIVEYSDSSLHFNITSPSGIVQFNNHFYPNKAPELKFDIIINNYQFISNTSLLVLSYIFNQENKNTISTNQENDTIYLNQGYFQVENRATASNQTIDVGLSSGSDSDGARVYLAYQHFTGKLIHDPIIGVTPGNPVETTNTTSNSMVSTDVVSVSQTIKSTYATSTLSYRSHNIWKSQPTDFEIILSSIIVSLIIVMLPVLIYFWKIGDLKR